MRLDASVGELSVTRVVSLRLFALANLGVLLESSLADLR